MILRLSATLSKKIKRAVKGWLPLDFNPYADWTLRLFTVERRHYILITNSAFLYSMVISGKGINSEATLLLQFRNSLEDFLRSDGHGSVYDRLIAPAMSDVIFSKALNKAVTGSMNDFVRHAEYALIEKNATLQALSQALNTIPMSYLRYCSPQQLFPPEDNTETGRQA